jgi:alpha-N-arabinofuranosidase
LTTAAAARRRSFTNPIIPGFHPDPTICRVGDDFYLATSSFEYFPGVPIFHSRDLVNWRQIGHVLTRKRQLDLEGAGSSRGIFAPTLRHDGRRFYLITTLIDRGGNFFVTARRPEGPWSDPIWLDEEGIDPSLCFDRQGRRTRVYYTRNGKGTDFDHPFIHQTELDLRTGHGHGSMRVVWRGLGGIWPEAPHLYHRRGRYYLFCAEGGTSYGHSEVVGRADAPFGPFRPAPRNPILGHARRRGHPIQATGHADVVELPDGSAWAVFLGIRPRPGRHHHLGRETFLAPVRFDADDWPVIGEGARGHVELRMAAPPLAPRPFPRPRARDDFDGRALAPCWMFLRNPPPGAVSLAARAGHLRLRGTAASLDEIGAPAFVGRRQQHFQVRCRARLEFDPVRDGEEAGLTVRAREEVHADVAVRRGAAGREAVAIARTGGAPRVLGRVALPAGPTELEIAATADAYALRVKVGRRFVTLGWVATRAFSAETIARRGTLHFTGAVVGMYATGRGTPARAAADFDWFEYRPGGEKLS